MPHWPHKLRIAIKHCITCRMGAAPPRTDLTWKRMHRRQKTFAWRPFEGLPWCVRGPSDAEDQVSRVARATDTVTLWTADCQRKFSIHAHQGSLVCCCCCCCRQSVILNDGRRRAARATPSLSDCSLPPWLCVQLRTNNCIDVHWIYRQTSTCTQCTSSPVYSCGLCI